MTEWLSRPARDGGPERMPTGEPTTAEERMPAGEPTPAEERMPAGERMPWTIVVALLISAVSVGAWVVGGLLLIAAPQRAQVTGDVLPVWIGGVAAGVAANAAVIVGGIRRREWTRWIVAMQALVMIVLLSAAEQGGWAVAGVLLLALQCVLITMPSANEWFAPQPPARSTSERAPRITPEPAARTTPEPAARTTSERAARTTSEREPRHPG